MQTCLDAIEGAVRSNWPQTLALLADLTAFESHSGGEQPAMDFLAEVFAQQGLAVGRIPMSALDGFQADTRTNLVATHEPHDDTGRSLLFNGHLDIVPSGPAALWDSPPFEATVRDGKVFGRGAADMKAGIVCALAAFQALRSLGVQPAGRVGFNAVVDEECSGRGALASALALPKYDAVIIPEPFDETIAQAQVGVFWVQIDVRGVASHVATMARGSNAIEIAMAVLRELKLLEARWNEPAFRHPLYRDVHHPINFNLGRIRGGEWTSSVPCACTMELRIGLYPGQSIESGQRAVEAAARCALSGIPGAPSIAFRYEGMQGEGCVLDLGHPAFAALEAAHESLHGTPPTRVSLTAATDARHFLVAGAMPATCYGPVSDRIHGVNEAVDIESMIRVASVFAKTMVDWCGCEPAVQADPA